MSYYYKSIFLYFFLILVGCSSTPSKTNNFDDTGGSVSGGENVALPYIKNLMVKVYDCADSSVLCVDDSVNSNQEFSTIQEAVDLASPGDTVLVNDGTYQGFRVNNSGLRGSEILITANGNTVVINSSNFRSGNDNIYISNSNFIIIEGFTVINADAYGIGSHDASADTPMRGLNIRHNIVYDSSSSNIYVSQTSDSSIIANTTYGSKNSHGIYLSNAGSDNVLIAANISYQNAKNGIHFNGDSRNGGDGLHKGLTVLDNKFFDNAANGIDADGVHDSSFINNLIYDNGRHGVRVFQIDASEGAGNLTFLNNTIVNNIGTAIKLTDDIGGHLFFNNILVDNNDGCIYTESSNLISDHNIYSENCSFIPNNTSLFYGTSSLASISNQLFSLSTADDYSLKTGSVAINSGIDELNGILAPSFDIDGKPRGGSKDIGAYEY